MSDFLSTPELEGTERLLAERRSDLQKLAGAVLDLDRKIALSQQHIRDEQAHVARMTDSREELLVLRRATENFIFDITKGAIK